jgi:cytochrome c oxidase subunit II
MRFAKTLAGVLAAAALTACATEYPQSSINPTTDFAHVIHELYVSIFWWTLLILVVVWAALAYILIRFRERPDSPEPKQVHGHLGLEIGWTIGPALIVVAIAIPTIQAVFATQSGDPENAMVVDVIGHQYWWEFRYPETGVVTANELHLPVDRPVSLRLHSADVIHSFWVPQLGGKRDVNPLVATPEGMDPKYNWIHFTAQETGTYMGQCAEFCGDSHSLMGMRVIVQDEADFQAWIRDWQASAPASAEPAAVQVAAAEGETPTETPAPAQDLADQGREIFHAQTCIACHAIQGTNAAGVLGPNLTLMGRRSTIGAGWMENTQENLERWIREPHLIKPGVLMPGVDRDSPLPQFWPATNLGDEQVRAIAAYLLSLR